MSTFAGITLANKSSDRRYRKPDRFQTCCLLLSAAVPDHGCAGVRPLCTHRARLLPGTPHLSEAEQRFVTSCIVGGQGGDLAR